MISTKTERTGWMKYHQGIHHLINIPYAQAHREASQGQRNSTNVDHGNLAGRHGRRVDGSECIRVGEGSPSTKEKALPDHSRKSGEVDHAKKGQETINGAVAPSLDTFIWLVEFIEEHGISMEVWFHKLCYIYEDGKQVSRRRLTEEELNRMYE